VQDYLRTLHGSSSLGLDTEGASFHRYVDRVYLIQLSGPAGSAIIDPLAMETPPGLGELLESPDIEVVLHDADYDLRLLHQDYGWTVRNVFDTRVAAQLLGIRAFGLGALLERFFGVKLDKRFQRADWSMRPLSPQMLDYAVQDTSWLMDLRDQLRNELAKRGRSAWAEEEFKRIEGTRWEAESPEDAFMRIKGARDLTRPQLGVLREVAAWRDAAARDLDRAVFRVLGNEPLLAIAQLDPVTLADLAKIKGMPRGILEKRGNELLAAIERGRNLPADQLPRFPRARRYERDAKFEERVTRMKAARDKAAQELDMDPGVLFSRERLESVARLAPRSTEELAGVEGVRRWQAELLGPQLIEAGG
jgi:ribonuclease D